MDKDKEKFYNLDTDGTIVDNEGKMIYSNKIRNDWIGKIIIYGFMLPITILGIFLGFLKNPNEFFRDIKEQKEHENWIKKLSDEQLEYFNPLNDVKVALENNKKFREHYSGDNYFLNPIASSLMYVDVFYPSMERKRIQEDIKFYRKDFKWI